MTLYNPPRERPLRIRHSVPTLWERAKAMFAAVRDTFALARDFAVGRLCLRERRRLSARLKPIEKIVRTLIVIEAVTFLLMTPEGRRLCAETRKIEPPAPPTPPARPQPALLPPGWHTIAALRPVIDPRVVEREQREALARNAAAAEKLTQLMEAIANPNAETPGADFRVLRWDHDSYRSLDTEDAPPRPTLRTRADPHYPILPSMLPGALKALAPPRLPPDTTTPDRDLARRFAALISVLANPEPVIRRLARTLAALPLDCLPLLGSGRITGRREGDPEIRGALKLGRRALYAYTKSDAWLRAPEPG